MAERRSRVWIWVLVGGGLFVLFVAAVFTVVYLGFGGNDEEASSFSSFGPKIGVVDLDGVIFSPKQVVPQLKKFADDDSVKAIILHVNSPGGGVAASEEIYREVKRIRDENKKRIVASIETVGASGAYYVASATNKIYADKGSIVGSIGVIAEWVNYGDLLRWAKLSPITMKAGEFKDTGSPTREMTPTEREYLQSLIDNMHTQFIQAVAAGRGAKEDDIRAIANGKVWTGEEAASMKLVDQIADFEGAVKDTARAVNISGEPNLVYPPKDKRSGLDLLFGDVSDYLPSREKILEQEPGFYYLWK
jgi:protease IV